jgi:hypothetical protein
VSVRYNSKQASVTSFNRGAASTDMTLHFAAAVEAGTYAIEISPCSLLPRVVHSLFAYHHTASATK